LKPDAPLVVREESMPDNIIIAVRRRKLRFFILH